MSRCIYGVYSSHILHRKMRKRSQIVSLFADAQVISRSSLSASLLKEEVFVMKNHDPSTISCHKLQLTMSLGNC